MSDFGALLKAYREEKWPLLSQSRLAERARLDHSFISRLESGKRMPTKEAVERIAEAMHLTATKRDYLLASAGFLPRDVSSLLANEPVVGDVLDLLQDESIEPGYRESLRAILRLLTSQARMMPTITVAVGG